MSLNARSAVLTAAVFAAVIAALPANAQNAEMNARGRRSGLPDIGRPYAIRVTTGAHSNAGFEKSLTQRDPSLGHWCWIPVTNYDQGYIRVGPGASKGSKAPERPAHVYVKPEHVPLPTNPAYKKPWKLANAGQNRSSSNVSAKLTAHLPRTESAVPQTSKSYGGSYADVGGRLLTPKVQISQSTSVSGKLLSRTK